MFSTLEDPKDGGGSTETGSKIDSKILGKGAFMESMKGLNNKNVL